MNNRESKIIKEKNNTELKKNKIKYSNKTRKGQRLFRKGNA